MELKIGQDKQGDDQKKIQSSIEKAGGVYWIVKTYDDFLIKIGQLH